MVEAKDLPVQLGSTLLIELSATDQVSGQIVWRDGDHVGVKFHQRISWGAVSRLSKQEGPAEAGPRKPEET